MSDLFLFSPSEATLAAEMYDLKRGLRALEDIKAIWRRRSSEIEIHQRRITNSKLPICRLPDDVLSLIFEPEPFYLGHPVLAYDKFRDDAASVCFRFRQVILSSPSCWSNIWFDTGIRANVDTAEDSRLRTLFRRSKCAPLQLTWKTEGGYYRDITKWRNYYTALLSHHAHRIRSLAFLASGSMVDFISLLGGASVQNLRHVRITGSSSKLEEETLHTWVALQAPLLTLQIINNDWSNVLALPSFSTMFNTTVLAYLVLITPIRILDVAAFLKCCPSLESLTWTYQGKHFTGGDLDSLSGHEFGRLRELKLENDPPGAILQRATTPKLQELTLFECALSFLQGQAIYPDLWNVKLYSAPSIKDFRSFLPRARYVTDFAIFATWEVMHETLECLIESVSWGQGVVGDGEVVEESWKLPWPHLKTLEIHGRGECPPEASVVLKHVGEILRANVGVKVLFYRPAQ